MIGRVLLLLLFLLSPLHLEASTTGTEFVAGDKFTISAHLFNDGSTPTPALLFVTAPPGFEALGETGARGEIEPGGHLSLNASYEVGDVTPGLYTFLVQGGGQSTRVVIRIGPVVAPPAARPPIYLPVWRA